MATEINVTSPIGVREIERGGGAPVAEPLLDATMARLS